MQNIREIQLISGEFEPSEAADVLLSLINDKMRHHTVKLLKLVDRSDDYIPSKQRIEELKTAKRTVIDAVLEANRKGLLLEIEGSILIRLRENGSQ